MKYIVLDTETAGLPVRKGWDTYHDPKQFDKYYSDCRVIELGYIVFDDDTQSQKFLTLISQFESLVIPNGFTINNSQYHGITTRKATEEGSPINIVFDQLTTDLKDCDVIVGHNINFDIYILLAEAYRMENNELAKLILSKKWFCTMDCGKRRMNVRKSPKLTELYEFLHKKPLQQEHRALSDVIVTASCYNKLMQVAD